MGQVTGPIQREARVRLALGAGVEGFCGVEDFLLSDRKGLLSPVCNHTGWGFCEGFRTSCRLAMPWDFRKDMAGPCDQEGLVHPPSDSLDE